MAETVTVTLPGLVPATVVTNCPFASVFPVAGEKLTPPPPDCVRVTGIPEAIFPPASLIKTVNVAGDAPLSGIDTTADVTSMVDPVIFIGTCAEMPFALAIIVAVRLEISSVPEEKSTLALPFASVTTEPGTRIPVAALIDIVAPCTVARLAFNAVIWMVDLLELSDLIVEALALNVKDLT